jgi:hypothetical protein
LGMVSDLAQAIALPKMVKIKQNFPNAEGMGQNEIIEAVKQQLNRKEILRHLTPGSTIAIGCGSRGITNIALIAKCTVQFLKQHGCKPFIFPAMGSHGGSTAAGQKEILRSLGITEKSMGCPIRSSMEVVQVGKTEDGRSVYIDRNASESDGIILINRIKPHPSFRGPCESGIAKMMVIGMGKQWGADSCHASGFGRMATDLITYRDVILKNVPIICGLGILETALENTLRIVSLTPNEIPVKEPELLLEAKQNMGRIYIDKTDVLIVDEIGKDISGDGMDPNITGTFCTPYASGGISAQRVVVLDLTDETHGAAVGMGMADISTKRLLNKVDFEKTYPNCITSRALEPIKIPLICENDREAIQIGIRTCFQVVDKNARIVRIKNSLELEYIEISESLLVQAMQNPNITILGEPQEMAFDQLGNLL